MIRLTTRDPLWQGQSQRSDELLAEAWIDTKRTEAQKFIDGIANRQRSARIAGLVKIVFPNMNGDRLIHYTQRENENFKRFGLDGFVYAAALNYVMVFLEEFVNREVQDLCDIILVRGQWTTIALSRDMSEAYHQVKEMGDQITAFDENLSEFGKGGSRLASAMLRLERGDKTQGRYIGQIIASIDAKALGFISAASRALIIVGKHIKNLADDYRKNPHELIINWKELSLASKFPITRRLEEDYRKIDSFTQLLQVYIDAGTE
jgi:hypothetical protein